MKHIFQFFYFWILLVFCACSYSNPSQTSLSAEGSILPKELPDHPRLFFTAGQEEQILKKAQQNQLLSDLIQVLRQEADKKLALPLQDHLPGRMLHVAREQISRILTLSMAYRLFGEENYAAKVEEELLNVSGFPDWNPRHFLDVAEMTTAVAIGYDWCYDYLSPATKKTVEDAIVEKAFEPAWPIYAREGKTPFSRENNWNIVCNTGMMNGALAIAEKYPEETERILRHAINFAPNVLESFAPDGVFNEGPMYWSYNGMFMSLLFDNLIRITGNDYGLPAFEGLDNTARYYIEQIGAIMESANFGDASERLDYSPTYFFLSRLYDQPDVAEFYRNILGSAIGEYNISGNFGFPRLFFLAIPWFDGTPVTNLKEERLKVFNGVTDLIIINDHSKSDPNRLHLTAKTGRGSWSHCQLDGGTFVLDCDGERWGIDMGPDSYSLPNFWDYKPGGERWNYFRNTNQSHSTLTIDNKIQYADGEGTILKYNSNSSQPFGIFDLSPYYPDEAVSVKRGFKLLGKKTLLMRDEVELQPHSKEISWRFVTNAQVRIDGNTATLAQNGKTFYIRCLLPSGYTMRSFPAKPNSEIERPISGVNIVEIKITPSARTATIPVVFTNNISQFKAGRETEVGLEKWN